MRLFLHHRAGYFVGPAPVEHRLLAHAVEPDARTRIAIAAAHRGIAVVFLSHSSLVVCCRLSRLGEPRAPTSQPWCGFGTMAAVLIYFRRRPPRATPTPLVFRCSYPRSLPESRATDASLGWFKSSARSDLDLLV